MFHPHVRLLFYYIISYIFVVFLCWTIKSNWNLPPNIVICCYLYEYVVIFIRWLWNVIQATSSIKTRKIARIITGGYQQHDLNKFSGKNFRDSLGSSIKMPRSRYWSLIVHRDYLPYFTHPVRNNEFQRIIAVKYCPFRWWYKGREVKNEKCGENVSFWAALKWGLNDERTNFQKL